MGVWAQNVQTSHLGDFEKKIKIKISKIHWVNLTNVSKNKNKKILRCVLTRCSDLYMDKYNYDEFSWEFFIRLSPFLQK